MASLYRQRTSQFWWVKFTDPNTGKIKRESTRIKAGGAVATRKAREVCATKALAEFKMDSAPSALNSQRWCNWAPSYLKVRYELQAATLRRYEQSWKTASLYLEEKKIRLPRELTRTHCLEYVAWRQRPDRKRGLLKASHNTALNDLKLLGLLMQEAVIRGWATANPCYKLGLKQAKAAVKPEYTDEDLALIQAQISKEPKRLHEFFKNSFEIARYQGCRLTETHLNPLQDVQLPADTDQGGTIVFQIKGGRAHTAPLHPKLVPLFRKLVEKGRTETYAMPKSPAAEWWHLIRNSGLKAAKPGACFHSLRVTAVSRLARTDIPERQTMAFIGHASTTVHRIYQRLRPTDLNACLTALD